MYFDHIFPLPKTQVHATCSNYSAVTGSNKEKDIDGRMVDEQGGSSGMPLNKSMCQKK
jgi:hypothetical protein